MVNGVRNARAWHALLGVEKTVIEDVEVDLCRHRDYAEAAGFRLPEASRREASDGVGPVVVSA